MKKYQYFALLLASLAVSGTSFAQSQDKKDTIEVNNKEETSAKPSFIEKFPFICV